MRRTLRQNAIALAVIGIAFGFFFQASKHAPRLSAVNPFADDPWDSVGSFAVQFVLFMIPVSLFRAFRRPSVSAAPATQVRGQLMTYIAIAFTLVADLVAMLRHQPLWSTFRAGYELIALTACLLFWTLAATVLLLLTTRALSLPPLRTIRMKIIVAPAAAVFVLAFYPEHLRQSLTGEIFTVLCGIVLLFGIVRAVGTAFVPRDAPSGSFDTAACDQPGLAGPRQRTAQRTSFVSCWLRSSRHRWILVIAAGILFGALLVTQELAEGGPSPHGGKRLLVIVVYLGLETAGVFTGYALLAEPLRLFPSD